MAFFLFLALLISAGLQAMEVKPESVGETKKMLMVVSARAALHKAQEKWGVAPQTMGQLCSIPAQGGRVRPCVACATRAQEANEELALEADGGRPRGTFALSRSCECLNIVALRKISGSNSSGSASDGAGSVQGSSSSGFSEQSHPFTFHSGAIPLNEDGTLLRLDGCALTLDQAKALLPLLTETNLDEIFAYGQ